MKQAQPSASKKGKFALNLKSYTLAILVHVVLFGIIMFNLFWNPTKKIEVGGGEVQPIQAQVIDETLLNQELERLKEQDELKELEELEKLKNLEELEKQAEEKKQEIERLEREQKEKEQLALEKEKEEQKKAQERAKQRELEEEKAAEAEKKRLAEEARLKELAIEKEKEEAEKKKKEEEALAQKKREEEKKKEEERQRKLEEEKKQEELAQKKREEEKRKKAEAEKARLEKERQEKELADKLAAEQALASERSQAASLFAQYIGPIKNKVTNSWIRPGTVRPGARAKVQVRVSPQGDVLTATIKQGSGDPIFDRSVINAVYKASPLPIPNDPRLYPHYRDFVFNFNPRG